MLSIGDCVVFLADGARGIIMEMNQDKVHVIWEDQFASWEKIDCLRKDEIV